MKKYCLVLITILIILCIGILVPKSNNVNAKSSATTIAEFRVYLASLQKEKQDKINDKNKTENSIATTKNDVKSKKEQIVINQNKITATQEESAKLEVDIKNGKSELEKLVRTYQVANSNNVYLEYIFDAKSYEDLVYRYAVMEQLMNYQEEQITKWKNKINYNEQLKKDLQVKEKELNNQINSLSKQLVSLGNKLADIVEESQDIDAEIKSVKEQIKFYQSIGCGENENIDKCISVKGDKAFRKPLTKGTVVSDFGYRMHPTQHVWKLHTGADISVKEGSDVYPIANGTVGKIVRQSDCGGNIVYIWHLVNGKQWTSVYMHLLKINVKLGDVVTSNTVIALSGGYTTGTRHGGYDTCTTGAHLHLGLATGWYQHKTDYSSYSQLIAHYVSPVKTLKLPKSWTSR